MGRGDEPARREHHGEHLRGLLIGFIVEHGAAGAEGGEGLAGEARLGHLPGVALDLARGAGPARRPADDDEIEGGVGVPGILDADGSHNVPQVLEASGHGLRYLPGAPPVTVVDDYPSHTQIIPQASRVRSFPGATVKRRRDYR